jgi:hypothetical protein
MHHSIPLCGNGFAIWVNKHDSLNNPKAFVTSLAPQGGALPVFGGGGMGSNLSCCELLTDVTYAIWHIFCTNFVKSHLGS